MSDQGLVAASSAIGFASHLYFHRYEPCSANVAVPILVCIPPTLLLLLQLPFSPENLSSAYLTFLGTLSMLIVVYRLFPFHPLAAYPGPMLGKATKLWTLGISAAGFHYLYLKRLHDKYGPYVRIGPDELSIVDAAAVNQVLGSGGLDKGRYFLAGRHESTPPTIVSLTGDAHSAKRRVWNRGMSSSAIREYDIFLVKRTRQLVERLESQSAPLDIVLWFDLFSLDLMGDISFGGGFELMKEGRDKDLIGSRIRGYSKASNLSGKIPWIIPTLYLLPFVGKMIQEFNDFGQRLALQRMKNGPPFGAKDLWYHLADEAGLEKERPTLESSAADGIVAVVAASDTTASTMAAFVWLMITNTEARLRVQAELDRVFPDVGDLDALYDPELHQDLEYLTACINETLRLHPPLPSNGGPRQATKGDRQIFGRMIPAGTSVYTPSYVLHRRPGYFSDPEKFIPERWLSPKARSRSPSASGETITITAHEPSAFIPFSLGSANCVGQRFAKREMLLVLAVLFRTFDFAFDDSEGAKKIETVAWTDSIEDFFVSTRGPMKVKLTRRTRA
ncbi:hypothetical protein HMN09_00011600 [Mycena chlorophos]|uniref:Cytochrome P450 n=1 Tax=Mycena chlorophos TaxID=658473 RepID=A0A8H6TSL6_MYCCL|nr:hypothetical protein HMN09_00011600 [Mycena chlorophos]